MEGEPEAGRGVDKVSTLGLHPSARLLALETAGPRGPGDSAQCTTHNVPGSAHELALHLVELTRPLALCQHPL